MAPSVTTKRRRAPLVATVFISTLLGVRALAGPPELDALRAEVKALRETVTAMDARIEELEARLAPPMAVQMSTDEPNLIERLANAARHPKGADEQPWFSPEAWPRVQLGMSAAEVIEVLGTPTFDEPSLNRTIDRVLTFQAHDNLTQRKVRGKVKFKRDQVVKIESPKFP